MTDVLRLIRAPNLLIAAGGVVGGGWIALGRVAGLFPLLAAAGAGIAIGAYGFIRNDVDDALADRANRPDRPVASGRVTPLRAERYATWALLIALVLLVLAIVAGAPPLPLAACVLAAWLVMRSYSRRLKRIAGIGNVAVALVAGLPLFFGAVAVGRPARGLVPWALAAWIHLIREVVKDLEDEAGDRVAGRRTLPIAIGPRAAELAGALVALAFVPASLYLPYADGYRGTYFLLALPAQMAVLVAASRLIAGRGGPGGAHTVSRTLKAGMVIGMVALVAGRLA